MSSILEKLLQGLSEPMLYDQSFGLGLNMITDSQHANKLSTQWRPVQTLSNTVEDAGFQVSLDVQQFKPEELSVKIKGDSVVVEACHEERQDQHGFVSRRFLRRYQLPEAVNSSALQASLSSDGVLQLSAPLTKSKEVKIPIVKANEVAMAMTNGDCNGDVAVNGHTNANGDVTADTRSPESSPVQPALKKSRIELGN